MRAAPNILCANKTRAAREQAIEEITAMPAKKRIVDARADSEGDISHVRFAGNRTFTPVGAAIRLADQGKIENAHSVRRRGAKTHLRTNPDSRERNNLDYMAGDD
jgi:hypothetical protein